MEKPHLEVIEGGKGKEKREPSWRARAGEELKTMDALAREVKNLEKEILDAKTEGARAGLVEALEEIEGKLRDARKEWKQIVIDATFPEPSKDVEAALGEIRKMEAGPSVMVAPEYAKEVERIEKEGAKPWETRETLMWEELRPGWEKDAEKAVAEVNKNGTPEEKALAAEILKSNTLPPRVEKDVEHEARRFERDAERADREVAKLEQELEKYGVNPDKLAASAVARFSLSFRTFWNGKLDNLMTRYQEALDHADRMRADAQIAALAPRDPMRSVAENAELIREYMNRRNSRRRRDDAYERLMQRTGSAPRLG